MLATFTAGEIPWTVNHSFARTAYVAPKDTCVVCNKDAQPAFVPSPNTTTHRPGTSHTKMDGFWQHSARKTQQHTHLGIVAGLLAPGIGVERAPHVLDLDLEILHAARLQNQGNARSGAQK